MIISTFTLAAPDGDGDMQTEFEVTGENPSEHEVRRIRLVSCFEALDGSLFAEHTSDEELRIETAEEFRLKAGPNWLKAAYCANGPQGVKATAYATLYRREMARLGEIAIPAEQGVVTRLQQRIESSCLNPDLRVLLMRNDSDEDGTSTLAFRCGVRNLAQEPIEHMVLKADLIDEDDAVLQSDVTTMDALPGVARVFESQIWGVRKSRLKRARLKLSLAVYLPILRETCTAEATPA